MSLTDDYNPATALSAYFLDRGSRGTARLWATEKLIHDLAAVGLVDFFEGYNSDPTEINGYGSDKLWLRVQPGVTATPGTIRVWSGDGVATSLANWVPLTAAHMMTYLRRAAGEAPSPSGSPLINVVDYGAVGDFDGTTGTSNNTALNSALDVSSAIYLPDGNYLFSTFHVLSRVLRSTIYGPGRLWYDNGSEIERIGSQFRLGVADANGNAGATTQGGVIIGGEGPGHDGVLLYASSPQWMQTVPTRSGAANELQVYTQCHIGQGTVSAAGDTITATYGDFTSDDIEVGDAIGVHSATLGIHKTVLIASKSSGSVTVTELNGSAISWPGSGTVTWEHAFYYADGTCDTAGTAVTRRSGDYFFDSAVVSGQKILKVNGTRYAVSSVGGVSSITLGSSAGTQSDVSFTLKMLSLARNTSLFRLQGLRGGSEENFAILNDIEGFARVQTQFAGGGEYRPIIIGTGPDESGSNRDHLTIGHEGRIGIGRDYAKSGWLNTAKVQIFRDPLVSHATDGSNDTNMLSLQTTHNSANPRRMNIGFYNNFNAGYIQGWQGTAETTPTAIAIQPQGGNVGIGTGYKSSLNAKLDVVNESAVTNAIVYTQRLTQRSTGTPAAGLGVGVAMAIEDSAGNDQVIGGIAFVSTDVTDTSEDADFVVSCEAGAAFTERFRVKSTGQLRVTSGAVAANGSVATAMSSVGPTGANTAIQGWLALDVAGTTRYLPYW